MPPEVSVLVPTRDRRAMVREAVESVLAQRWVDFELIVIDDGSTDGTGEELREFADRTNRGRPEPLMRVARTEGGGPARARNLGSTLARAPMIAFLDSDDLWSPGKLARQLAYIRVHPRYAVCQTGEIWTRAATRVNPGRRHCKRAGDIFADSLRTCLISPSAAMLRTDLFRELGGFDEDMAAAEDYDLWLRILVDHEAGFLDEPLVTRRAGHPGQLSTTVAALDRFRILALVKLLAGGRLSAPQRAAVLGVLAEKCAIYSGGLRRRGRNREAIFYEDVACEADRQRFGRGGEFAGIIFAGVIETMRAMLRERAAEPERAAQG